MRRSQVLHISEELDVSCEEKRSKDEQRAGWACHSRAQEIPSRGLPCVQLCGLGLGQDARQTEIPFSEKLVFRE